MAVLFALVTLLAPMCSGYVLRRHVDPRELEYQNPFAPHLFEIYGSVFSSLVTGEYDYSRSLVDLILDVYVPPDAREVFDGYNALLPVLIENFKLTELSIRDALGYLRWLRSDPAEEALTRALGYLSEASDTVGLIEGSSRDVAAYLKESPDELLQGVEDLLLKLSAYESDIAEADEKAELLKMEGREVTLLTIQADEREVIVGGILTVSGTLSGSEGESFPGKVVELYFDGDRAVEVSTGSDGGFVTEIMVPFIYTESAFAHAEYWPGGEDALELAPSASNSLEVGLRHYTPSIELQLPELCYPSLPTMVHGEVTYDGGPLEGIDLRVACLQRTWSLKTGAGGDVAFDFVVPPDVTEGSLRVDVVSLPSGVYGPARAVEFVEVSRLPISFDVEGPVWTFSGGHAVIGGNVLINGLPLAECVIELLGEDQVWSTSTLGDGSFSAYLEFPGTMMSERYSYSVVARPLEPWMGSSVVEGSVIVVNVATSFAMSVFLGVVLFSGFRRLKGSGDVNAKVERVKIPQGSCDYPDRGGLAGVYVRAVKFVAKRAGELLLPSHTIREYLALIRGKLVPRLYGLFERLSLLYERWFYRGGGGRPPVGSAERLFDHMRGKSEDEG